MKLWLPLSPTIRGRRRGYPCGNLFPSASRSEVRLVETILSSDLPPKHSLGQRPRVRRRRTAEVAGEGGHGNVVHRTGNPWENGYCERFNGKLRDECLNVNWFLSLEDARGKIEAWRRHYNESRPHSALEDVPPREFASKGGASPALAGSARPGIFTP